jgi:hypothetical protein
VSMMRRSRSARSLRCQGSERVATTFGVWARAYVRCLSGEEARVYRFIRPSTAKIDAFPTQVARARGICRGERLTRFARHAAPANPPTGIRWASESSARTERTDGTHRRRNRDEASSRIRKAA